MPNTALGVEHAEVTKVVRNNSARGKWGAILTVRITEAHRLAFVVLPDGALPSGSSFATGRSNVVALMLDNKSPEPVILSVDRYNVTSDQQPVFVVDF